MSDIKQQLEIDIKRFFDNTEKMNHSDKVQALKNLFEKYLHLNTTSYLMDYIDLNNIMGSSKDIFVNKTFPVFLGDRKRRVLEGEQTALCIIEATIAFLNSKECLKKLPKFDYREDKF